MRGDFGNDMPAAPHRSVISFRLHCVQLPEILGDSLQRIPQRRNFGNRKLTLPASGRKRRAGKHPPRNGYLAAE